MLLLFEWTMAATIRQGQAVASTRGRGRDLVHVEALENLLDIVLRDIESQKFPDQPSHLHHIQRPTP